MWHCPAIFCKIGKRVLELQMYLHGRATTFTNPFVLVGLSQNRATLAILVSMCGFHGLPYILPLSTEDSVVVGLGREEAAFLKMDSATSSGRLTFTA